MQTRDDAALSRKINTISRVQSPLQCGIIACVSTDEALGEQVLEDKGHDFCAVSHVLHADPFVGLVGEVK